MTAKNTERYKQGKIYKLVNDVDDEIYVGSTCLPLCKRLYNHKTAAKRNVNRPVYAHLNIIGMDKVKIILIEEYSCNNKMELERQERHHIETLKPGLNRQIPGRTQAEWQIDNKDELSVKKRIYNNTRKTKIAKQTSMKYTCGCGSVLSKSSKSTHVKTEKHIIYVDTECGE